MQTSQPSIENSNVTIEEALASLRNAGLIATLTNDSRIHGGFAMRTEEGSRFTVDPFKIYLDGSEWVAEIPVRQCYVTVKRSPHLIEVVDSIRFLYKPQAEPKRSLMTIKEALAKLKSAHLLVRYVGGADRLIAGGTHAIWKNRYKEFSDPFSIHRMGDGWLATSGECENLNILGSVGSLQEVVETVCNVYRSKANTD